MHPCDPLSKLPARGYASGAFDLLHVGHVRYLQMAAAACRHLLVGVPDDEIIARVKGRLPLVPQSERRELLSALSCVSEAMAVSVPMDDTDAFAEFMSSLRINIVFIGADWAETPRWQRLGPALQVRGMEVRFLPRTIGISSTQRRNITTRLVTPP
ncbi:hypothetical protein IP70_13065 [alpha proteobacterium AAP38]|nr:hypothetical protein IP70_13065 [alpha proteobacterium AAP38]